MSIEICIGLQKSLKWLKGLSKGHELEALTLEGLLIVDAQKGSIRYNFVVSSRDPDGNWHVGAMATLIDDLGFTQLPTMSNPPLISISRFIQQPGLKIIFLFDKILKSLSFSFSGFWFEDR
ncbi:Thioesterase superfamily [Gossypium australe]|uniref:Thioesterase superfamily n=1 Tax=Gossypium australe TaxID=47621 RepID=A0A5B6WDL1_9ROSI|nr:Thioesterase superfamily [Gossypium australe]